MDNTVYIMVGAQGSGKSTLAQEIAKRENAVICSADDYFVDEKGVYDFDFSKLGTAHNVCKNKFHFALQHGQNIVVDNTNGSWKEIRHYILGAAYYGYKCHIMEPDTPWKYDAQHCAEYCVHNVPIQAIQAKISQVANLMRELPNLVKNIFSKVEVSLSGVIECH